MHTIRRMGRSNKGISGQTTQGGQEQGAWVDAANMSGKAYLQVETTARGSRQLPATVVSTVDQITAAFGIGDVDHRRTTTREWAAETAEAAAVRNLVVVNNRDSVEDAVLVACATAAERQWQVRLKPVIRKDGILAITLHLRDATRATAAWGRGKVVELRYALDCFIGSDFLFNNSRVVAMCFRRHFCPACVPH